MTAAKDKLAAAPDNTQWDEVVDPPIEDPPSKEEPGPIVRWYVGARQIRVGKDLRTVHRVIHPDTKEVSEIWGSAMLDRRLRGMEGAKVRIGYIGSKKVTNGTMKEYAVASGRGERIPSKTLRRLQAQLERSTETANQNPDAGGGPNDFSDDDDDADIPF